MKFGIVVITYNRLHCVKRLVESLQNAWYDGDTVDLIISIDKSNTDLVEKWADKQTWKHGAYKVIRHEKNLGLRAHVLECGNRVKDYDAIAVFEDDVTASPNFYRYSKQCVDKYKDDDRIAGISLYGFPHAGMDLHAFTPLASGYDVYFMSIAQSWGQIWMKHQWEDFYNWYTNDPSEFGYAPRLNKLYNWPKSSWLKYHIKYCIEKNKYFVYPYHSLSTNNSDAGTHAKKQLRSNTLCQSNLQTLPQNKYSLPSLDECSVKYDFYYEAQFLGKYLGVNEENLCVDLYGDKRNEEHKRYWLTCEPAPYKIIKSFDLAYKPWENNIILNKQGDLIFLYDTYQSGEEPMTDMEYRYKYMYRNGLQKAYSIMGHWLPLNIIFGGYLKRKLKGVSK